METGLDGWSADACERDGVLSGIKGVEARLKNLGIGSSYKPEPSDNKRRQPFASPCRHTVPHRGTLSGRRRSILPHKWRTAWGNYKKKRGQPMRLPPKDIRSDRGRRWERLGDLWVPTAEDTIAILNLVVAALALPHWIGHDRLAVSIPSLPAPAA